MNAAAKLARYGEHARPLSNHQVPSLVEVQMLLNRGRTMLGVPPLPMTKVPSLKELNARVASPVALPFVAIAQQQYEQQQQQQQHANDARAAAANPPPDPSGDGDLAPCAGKVCFNCRTQKTPLWRNGPDGPKTLCNACGVRFKLGKLPPPGGFPPGHVIPKPPPRKRPAGKLVDAEGKVKKQRVGGDEANPNLTGARKKKRTIRLHNPNANGFHHNDENHGARFTAHGKLHAARSAEAMTEYDGAVLLMVLAGLYNQ